MKPTTAGIQPQRSPPRPVEGKGNRKTGRLEEDQNRKTRRSPNSLSPCLAGSHQQKSTQEPRLHHELSTYFVHEKVWFLLVNTQNSKAKPNPTLQKPKTHHNSPQKPNKRFIHKKVVGPLLLTFVFPGKPLHSPVPLMRPPKLPPGHARRSTNKNIRMVLALFVLHPLRVPVMPRPPA